ncbi:MAG: AI-2E family transporter [Actinobacteria bacterium 13_2_20CM_2_71_6]|nr:MAG: AI-2E family transporter [Actinobacteria bacterium 13_2_20CM_2_71_6]
MSRFEQVRANIRRAYAAGRATVRPNNHDDLDDEPIDGASLVLDQPDGDDQQVPYPLRIAAAWSWRLLIVVAAGAAVIWAVAKLHQVMIPVAISLLLSALLSPAVVWLRRRVRLHRSLATAIVMIGGLAAVGGTLTLVITQFVSSWPTLSQKAGGGIDRIQGWLRRGPLHLSDQQMSSVITEAQKWLTDHRSTLTTGALSTATTAIDVLASTFLVLFTTFFFLRDGRRIWRFLVNLLPPGAREPLGSAGDQSWQTLVAYVRATVLVAFIDAVGIGIGLVLLRVDLAFPLAALVFLGAFIPIIGATLSGTVAILVALVTRNPLVAFGVLLVVVGVQQLEGHVLQPAIMGKAVAIHPLAVIVAIATGLVLAGIIGALVAVPIVAVLNTGIRHLAAQRRHDAEPAPPKDVVVRS